MTSRDPSRTPFREVYWEFGRGTLSTSSSASRRRGYMTFSDHHRPSESKPEEPKKDLSDTSNFVYLNGILLKAHFSALFTALSESDFITSLDREKLNRKMDRPDFEKFILASWMRNYSRYIETRNLSDFLNSLLH